MHIQTCTFNIILTVLVCYVLVAYDTDLDIDYPDCATGLSFALE